MSFGAKRAEIREWWKLYRRGQVSLGTFIVAFITILVAVVLFSPIVEAVSTAAANATAIQATVLNLVPLLYVLLILAVIAVELLIAFRRAR